ncbi:MAG: alpha-glucosidase/alpha-galactosidase [Dehalococcoidales bacterium]
MPKVVFIGGGNYIFGRDFISDILSYPDFEDITLTLMDVDKGRLDISTAYARRLAKQLGVNLFIESTTDRRAALDGADYVLNSFRSGGWPPVIKDREITMKYGIEIQSDAMGVGGVFSGLRHVPDVLEICHDMEELCPGAWLFNYSNPQAIICWAVNDYTRIKNIGLCPNPYHFARAISRYAQIPFNELYYSVAGLNHFAWFVTLQWHNEDLYPRLRETFKDPNIYLKPNPPVGHVDLVEVEALQTFGYFTSGGGHLTLSLPYFRRKPELLERYKINSLTNMYAYVETEITERDEALQKQLQSSFKFPLSRDHTDTGIAVDIINSIETGKPARIFGNVKNNSLITNLLEGCVVEVPCLIDRGGIHPYHIGALPPQCAALNRISINVQEMAVKGIVEKDKKKILQAILLDPLTFSMASIAEIKQMVDELFDVEMKKYLKGYQ